MGKSKVEAVFQNLYPDRYSRLTGNGTTGIYLALTSLGLRNKFIAIPNNVCYNVPLAVKLSDNIPVFMDIEKATLCISHHELTTCSENIAAVIGVHAYGNVCDVNEIKKFCDKRNIIFIEDCAVAQGATAKGMPVGNFGDVSVLSFGAGKIVDSGLGGAVSTNDKSLYKEINKVNNKLPDYSAINSKQIEELNQFHTRLYNSYFLNDQQALCHRFWGAAAKRLKDFLFRIPVQFEDKITEKFQYLNEIISNRKRNWERLYKLIGNRHPFIKISDPCIGSVPWRFNLFIHRNRNRLIKNLLQKGYRISSWYPSVDFFFARRNTDSAPTPISDWVGDHILNVWINDEIDEQYLKDISATITGFNFVQ